MSKMTHLCLGTCTLLMLTFGLLWTPTRALAAPEGPGCPTVHTIALGENLTVIAAQYEVSVAALIEENGIDDADLIVEGHSLCIPAHDGPGIENWGSYGVPGQSYDPSLIKKQGGHAAQEENYGTQDHGTNNPMPMVPGKSYDPSLYGNQSNSRNSESWQPQQSPEKSYAVPGKGDEPQVKPDHYWKDDGYFPAYTPKIEEDDVDPTPTPEVIIEPE